jgi:hypothetical protein
MVSSVPACSSASNSHPQDIPLFSEHSYLESKLPHFQDDIASWIDYDPPLVTDYTDDMDTINKNVLAPSSIFATAENDHEQESRHPCPCGSGIQEYFQEAEVVATPQRLTTDTTSATQEPTTGAVAGHVCPSAATTEKILSPTIISPEEERADVVEPMKFDNDDIDGEGMYA